MRGPPHPPAPSPDDKNQERRQERGSRAFGILPSPEAGTLSAVEGSLQERGRG
jgi:hypothetical protein